ncbi:MAG: leucine-rich repeat protein [Eggerthellaceae bacterium]|nr:leucine-rich repeat protein [Eggerthellaceae bacterium]
MPLASALAGGPTAFVRADVALDGEPIVGSFTVDGMTFAVADSDAVELVGVSPGEGSDALAIPASVSFEGVDYAVSVIGAYAFYLSGIASVELPASVGNVDERAFRSSDVASVEVDPANPSYASFDGILYDASFSRLLLIPGGRTGAARISSKAEEVDAQAFSHCAGVTAISVDAGSSSYSSWDGLLYDADGSTLLRVPAGATDITIRDGCTTIAAGAMEACASLATITAPASVTSVSPDVFTSVPTVSLPVASAAADGSGAGAQLTALVALSSADDGLPEVDPSAITVSLPEEKDAAAWEAVGFSRVQADSSDGFDAESEEVIGPVVEAISSAATERALAHTFTLDGNGGSVYGAASYPVMAVTWDAAVGSVWDLTISGATYSWVDRSTGISYSRSAARSGYTFAFWGETATATSGITSLLVYFDTSYTAVTTLYAIWNIPVTWNANGGYWGSNTADTAAKSENKYYGQSSQGYGGSTVPKRTGYTFGGWYDTSAATGGTQYYTASCASARTWNKTANTTLYARWTANTYTVSFSANSGSGGQAANVTATYDSAMPTISTTKPTRAGYTFGGWYDTSSATGGTQYYTAAGASARTWNKTANTTLYARWTANPITLTWNSQGGSSVANTSATYSSSAKVPMPASNPTRAGYTFAGWWTAASGGTQVTSSTALPTANATYHAHWSLNPYSITYELDGGSVSGNPTTYNAETASFTLKSPTRTGYTFAGWSGTGLSGSANKTVTIAKGSTGDRSYTAHWTPAISADVPFEVTARVDLLGIEEQEEATGYIESRCGEPLTVADVAFEPLAGATELFGAASVADVALEVLAAGSTVPDARFALNASASQAPASAAAFRMASYGTRVPISYRFAIPDELLPTLTEATTPVCSVTYTMALANPES